MNKKITGTAAAKAALAAHYALLLGLDSP